MDHICTLPIDLQLAFYVVNFAFIFFLPVAIICRSDNMLFLFSEQRKHIQLHEWRMIKNNDLRIQAFSHEGDSVGIID